MGNKPMILAVSGVKNSGKTTLIQRILPSLKEAGLRVAVVKHDGHSFEGDPPGTDTGRYLLAGAYGAAIFDGEKYKIIEHRPVEETQLIARFPDADLILLEGFKHSRWPKLELVRKGNSDTCVCAPETVAALVTDTDLQLDGIPTFALDDIQGISNFLIAMIEERG